MNLVSMPSISGDLNEESLPTIYIKIHEFVTNVSQVMHIQYIDESCSISMKVKIKIIRKKTFVTWLPCNGFALIATISVMVLLVMVALAMLSLSTITSRTDFHDIAQERAKGNARMALMIALGELQMELGNDQRISAPASILEDAKQTSSAYGVENPHWLGVWDAAQEGKKVTYEDGRKNSFRKWLVSLDEDPQFEHAKTLLLNQQNSVTMGKPDANGKSPSAGLISTPDLGKYAWIVSDNSIKARINLPKEGTKSIADMIVRRTAATRHTAELVTGASKLPTDKADTAKLITAETAEIAAAGGVTGKHWRDSLTSDSLSLMTNVVRGGWKRDINTLMEMNDRKEFERLGYGQWEGRSAFGSQEAYLYGPSVALGARWNHLHTYYNLYKDVTFQGGVPQIKPASDLIDWRLADAYRDFGDEAGGFRFPRVAKLIYTFSYSSRKLSSGKYRLQLVTDVFVTVWNPYNTRIVFPKDSCMFIKFSKGIPMRFNWFVNGVSKGEAALHEIISDRRPIFVNARMYNKKHGHLFAMDPGETTVFSMRLGPDGKQEFHPGVEYDYDAARNEDVAGRWMRLDGNASDKISVSLKPDENSAAYNIGGQKTSQYCDFWIWDTNKGWPYYEHRGEVISKWDAPFIQNMPAVYHKDIRSVSFGEVHGKKQPFGAFIIEIKTARDSKNPSIAFLHSGISRLSSRVGNNDGEWNNERMEYKLEPLTSFNGDILQVSVPSHPAGANRGFIGSGRDFGTGVTHVMHAGIPLLPMTSLAQFQHAGVGDGASTLRATHWGFNSTPNPPYMDYAVGNSYAHPLIPKDSKKQNNYYDHSYHANEVLWDHYFCSSIAPQTQSIFYNPREMKVVWTDFVNKRTPLLNPRYSLYYSGKTTKQLEDIVYSGSSLKSDAFKQVASRLLYQGGFNVNSTSVEAWKAFLSGSYRDKVRHLNALSTQVKAHTEAAQGIPFSRTSLPLASRIDGSSNSIQNHYLGYRDLSETDITQLAEKIVEEVKKRGPFLSLSDFVNRQLSSETELARSGALQAAIDASDINDIIAAHGVQTDGAGKGFAFPEAAKGNTAMGTPGWLMQGDLLTTLGPSIFVRGDTFTVRAYGDARDESGRVLARAYCEAVVQRLPDYVDSGDKPTAVPPTLNVNKRLGRKFSVVQFRWLKPSDLN